MGVSPSVDYDNVSLIDGHKKLHIKSKYEKMVEELNMEKKQIISNMTGLNSSKSSSTHSMKSF